MAARAYKHESEAFDPTTGEIVYDSTYTVSSATEDDYIKVYSYLNTVFAFKGVNPKLIPLLIEISSYMTFADKGQEVTLVKRVKEKIAESLDMTARTVDNYIIELKKADILRPVGQSVYSVNPFIIGRGKWSDIKELRAQFDFNTGLMATQSIVHDKITGEEIAKITQEVKKKRKDQIPGQMTLDLDDLPEPEEPPEPTPAPKPRKKRPAPRKEKTS